MWRVCRHRSSSSHGHHHFCSCCFVGCFRINHSQQRVHQISRQNDGAKKISKLRYPGGKTVVFRSKQQPMHFTIDLSVSPLVVYILMHVLAPSHTCSRSCCVQTQLQPLAPITFENHGSGSQQRGWCSITKLHEEPTAKRCHDQDGKSHRGQYTVSKMLHNHCNIERRL